jgi:hypothetical protein
MADNFNMKTFLAENKLGPYAKAKLNENMNIASRIMAYADENNMKASKEQKIQVIKEWIWFTCDEGQAKDDINKYNKMVDMYFANKNDVTKQDFKNIWNIVIQKWGVGDAGADSEGFYETWEDIQTGTLVNPGMTYEGKEKKIEEGESPVHFYVTGRTDANKNKQIKDIAAKAGINIKMNVLDPEDDVQITLPGGTNFKMKDAEKVAKILDKFDTEWEDTIGLGFSMKETKKEEGYMGTQYDSSEDMAADMVKKGITREEKGLDEAMTMEDTFALIKQVGTKLEDLYTQLKDMKKDIQSGDNSITADKVLNVALKTFAEIRAMEDAAEAFGLQETKDVEESLNEALAPQSYERMSNLSNLKAQQAMIRAAEIMMNELTAEGFEVEEVREFFTQLIANDI